MHLVRSSDSVREKYIRWSAPIMYSILAIPLPSFDRIFSPAALTLGTDWGDHLQFNISHSLVRACFRQILSGMPLIYKLWNLFICRFTGYAQKNPSLVLTFSDFFKLLFWSICTMHYKLRKWGARKKVRKKNYIAPPGFEPGIICV